jgi:folate-binding protein YgfZ
MKPDGPNRGKIEVAGTEAAVFLHNLATNDIKSLAVNQECETFFCTATAKVIAHGWVRRMPPDGKRDLFYLDLDPGCADKLYQHLDRHLISEDVTLRNLTEAGPATDDAEARDIRRVEAGMPLYGKDMDETTFVAEVGRTREAISYSKGCYLGQEPIVMARDRGIVQRTLLGLKLDDEVPSGSLLYRDGKEVGRTTSCVRSPRFGPIALAYVKRGSQAPGTAVEVEVNGQRRPATVAALPFSEA